jgi:hypothetical protein
VDHVEQRLEALRAVGDRGPGVAIVRSSGLIVASSSHSNGHETVARSNARTDHGANTVLCGAFWL